MLGNAGIDHIFGGGGNDTLLGGGGRDYIVGGAGKDVIDGGHGTDHLVGGGGHDWLFGGTSRYKYSDEYDRIFGGAGDDTAEDPAIGDLYVPVDLYDSIEVKVP